jgi:ankyrin repeat protein
VGTIDLLKKHIIFKVFIICCLILAFSYILVIDGISAEEFDQEKFDFHVKFIESIENGEDVELIKGYLDQGADPNLNNLGHGPALWTAAWVNSGPEVVKLLLDYGAKTDINDLGRFMVFECNLDNIRLLLENAVDVNKEIRDSIFGPYISTDKYFIEEASKENKLQVDLFRALKNSPLVMAVEAGRIELAELLIGFGADLDLSTGYNKNTPLRAAALNNQHPELVRMLLRAGADPGLADSDGYTPLMAAAESGNLEAAQFLLIYGAELNAQSVLKMSPLKGAVMSKNYELVSYFIEEGADLEMTYNSGMNILHFAAAHSSLKIVELLLEKGLDPLSTDNEKRTPYHLALINDNHSVLNKLKEYGGEKIIASFLSEYLQEKDLKAEDSLHYKFSKDGEKLLTIDDDGEREHIRVWHKYKDDYFLTRLDYKFKVAEGKSSYTIYRNLYLSPYGNMLVIYDAENNRIYLDGLSMGFYKRTNFEEAAEADFVTLSLVYKDDAYQKIVAVYKRDSSLYLKKWDIVREKNYIYLTDRGEGEYQLNIDDDVIIDSFGVSYQLIPWDKINPSLSTIFGESETVNIRGKKSLDFEIKLAYSEDSSRAYSYKLQLEREKVIADNQEIFRRTTGYYLVSEGEKNFENLLSYSGSTYSEYSIEAATATIEFLNEVKLNANIIAAGFDYVDNKWILLTNKGLIKRDIMSREEAAIKSILSKTSGLLDAGFKEKWLEKIQEAMEIDPAYEYFQSSLYMNMAAKGFEVKAIGELILLNYNLLMEVDEPAKDQMITRLIEYGLFAERAGQRALVKQAAQKINSLSSLDGFKGYQREIGVASAVLESIYVLVGDNPEQAYNYLLENRILELGQESRLLLKEKIVKNPALWQSLFIDKNKIAYLLGIEKDKIPQQLKYNETVPLPYPDLEGNIIEGINTNNEDSTSGSVSDDLNSANNDNTDSDSGSIGTVLD